MKNEIHIKKIKQDDQTKYQVEIWSNYKSKYNAYTRADVKIFDTLEEAEEYKKSQEEV